VVSHRPSSDAFLAGFFIQAATTLRSAISNRNSQLLEFSLTRSKQRPGPISNRNKFALSQNLAPIAQPISLAATSPLTSRQCILDHMLDLDCGLEFDAAQEAEFFASLPPRPGIFILEMNAAGALPYLARTADIRRAAERLLREPETLSKRLNLRRVAARIRYRVTASKFEQTFALYQQARLHFPRRYRDLMRLRPPALLKVNLRNEYPRCYVTRRIRVDDGFYFGPFASRRSADAFAEGFLDLFKIRRCQIKIRRDPAFPGCIYSEMKMCLAPCFAGCTKQEYDDEVGRVLETLDTSGAALVERIEREREAASEALDFERAASLHKRLEKVSDALRGLPEVVRRLEDLDAVILQRATEEMSIIVFPVRAGIFAEPLFLRFAELSSQPRSVEAILRKELEPETPSGEPESRTDESSQDQRIRYGLREAPPDLPEHLSLLARWFYSKPREGEIFFRDADWPYRRILRACGRLLGASGPAQFGAHRPS
jgi:excinuclease ABC subunit C